MRLASIVLPATRLEIKETDTGGPAPGSACMMQQEYQLHHHTGDPAPGAAVHDVTGVPTASSQTQQLPLLNYSMHSTVNMPVMFTDNMPDNIYQHASGVDMAVNTTP